jgi:hypothetical protein
MGLGGDKLERSRQNQCLGKTSLAMVCLLGLTACFGLNNQQIAETIKQDVLKKGGRSLKSVTCPQGVKPETGKTFECVGKVDNGYTFTIPVQQRDSKGAVTWEIPHAKGLLNLPKLETLIQIALAKEISSPPTVTCGSRENGNQYKALHPGEGFECRVAYKLLKPVKTANLATKNKSSAHNAANSKANPKNSITSPKTIEVTQTERITITTDQDGNISWQRILPN